jgi:hypothetical protein
LLATPSGLGTSEIWQNPADTHEKAQMEGFFANMKTELVHFIAKVLDK